MHRAARLGLRQRRGEHQAGAAPRDRGVVGHAGIEAEQGHKRAQQTLGLPPGLTKGQAQQVAGLDRQVRIVARSSAPARVGRLPGRQRLRCHPHRQAALPFRCCVSSA